MFALASKTGWPESYIYRDLPLSRVLQYLHCAQTANPYVWTVSTAAIPIAVGSDEDIALLTAADDTIDLSTE